MHMLHDFLHRMGAGHRQYLWVSLLHHVTLGTETAGDDYLAVFRQRFADGIQRFGHGAVNEATGIDYDQVGVVVGGHDVITLGPQLGKDLLGIDQGLGTAEADKADFGWGTHRWIITLNALLQGTVVKGHC